jgi:hypothetical protein
MVAESCPDDVAFTFIAISLAGMQTLLMVVVNRWKETKTAIAEEQDRERFHEQLLDNKDKDGNSLRSFDSVNKQDLLTTPTVASSDFKESCLPLTSLANHPNLSSLDLYLVCCSLAVSWALFFWSHMEQYSEIGGEIRVGEIVQPIVLSGMGLAASTCDFWAADVWFLGAGTFMACGFLPYLKCNLLAYTMFAPRDWLSLDSRKAILKGLDQMNKLIIVINVATAITCLMMTFKIGGPLGEGQGLLDVDMYVELGTAFYINIAASFSIYFVGAYVLFLHRAKEEPTIPFLAHLASQSQAPIAHDAPRFSWYGGTLISQCVAYCTLAVAFMATVRGCFADSFCLEVGGFLGIAVGEGEVCYSVINTATKLPGLMPNPEEFGVQLSMVLLIFLTFFLPVCHMLMLLTLYAAPLTVIRQHQLFYATEIVAAWACLDLFCCGIFANAMEFSKFADAISDSVMEELPEEGLEPIEQLGGILQLTCSMTIWFAVLALAIVCTHIMHYQIMGKAEELINARARKQYGQLQMSAKGVPKFIDPKNGERDSAVISLRELAEAETDSWSAMNRPN